MTPKDQAKADAQTATAEPEQAPDLEQQTGEQAGSTALQAVDAPSFALERQPIIDLIPERQVALLKARAPRLNHAELAAAVELAWSYKLDPFANEIWFTKSRGRNGGEGKLLIMVGRDGLRKIAQRNGLEVDGDVVRAHDLFRVTRGADRQRVVEHEYQGSADDRGEIVGAWAECWERKTNRQRGFFYAPIGEYEPAQTDGYSPWGKQVSVMVLAAAERQAVRQATPLGGLLIEGEDVLVNEAGETLPAPEAAPFEGYPHAGEIERVIERARQLGHVGYASVATAQMALQGLPEDRVRGWLERANADLDQLEGEPEPDAEPVDAEVVDDSSDSQPVSEPAAQGGPRARPLDGHAATAADDAPGAPIPEDAERARELRDDAAARRAWAEGAEDDGEREQAEAEAADLEAQADALDAGQTDLGL
jgi:hypothetical protein